MSTGEEDILGWEKSPKQEEEGEDGAESQSGVEAIANSQPQFGTRGWSCLCTAPKRNYVYSTWHCYSAACFMIK